MKHVVFTILLTIVWSLSLQAKSIRPIIFDDPSFDIRTAELTAEQHSFFDRYLDAMTKMEAGEEAEKYFIIERADVEDGIVVAPLLGEINFNQGTPYNDKCPYMNGGRAVTGCVATAMAEVMRYWKYPAHGTGTFTYTGGKDGAKTVNLENMPFVWENILPTYDNGVSYTAAQADAVSTLMLACGAALGMNYDVDGSGANTAKVNGLLKNNFGYDKAASFASTEGSTDPDDVIYWWGVEAVRPDLEAGRPLIFAGYPSVGQTGHCFVIDGYMVEEGMYYYHVNWGWGGHGNSWCLLNKLQDYDGHNYSGHNLQMVYNIYPTGQGIESAEGDNAKSAVKKIENGQLIIERNETRYTVQGQRIL